jgi:hypothetical protein
VWVWTLDYQQRNRLLTESSSSASNSLPNVSDITCSEATLHSAGQTVQTEVLSSNELGRQTRARMQIRLRHTEEARGSCFIQNEHPNEHPNVAAEHSPLQTKRGTLHRACASSPTAPEASRSSWPARWIPIVNGGEFTGEAESEGLFQTRDVDLEKLP